MQSEARPTVSKLSLWTGRILSALAVAAFTMSAVLKFRGPPEFASEFERLGYGPPLAFGLGIVELTCAALYAIPQTAVLGAVLLTGYLGGATATHFRVGDPYYAPVILGVIVWIALFLRDGRLRQLLPWRR